MGYTGADMAERREPQSSLEDEAAIRWGFLEEDALALAAVSDRMELVYLNESARELVPVSWFGKRCFEVFPVADELCAFSCPTIHAVHEATEIRHCHESLKLDNGVNRELEVAVIPLGSAKKRATALLLLRNQEILANPEEDERKLFEDAERVRQRVIARLGH